jgi:hypothetical protein
MNHVARLHDRTIGELKKSWNGDPGKAKGIKVNHQRDESTTLGG